MSDQKKVTVNAVEVDPLERARGFWDRYQKAIIGVGAAIILVVGGWLVYKNYFKEPAEQRAAEAMYKAEEYFKSDSLNTALNGDGTHKGFLYIIKNYGGTKSANLAHYYVGNIYLQNGDYNNAVKYLKEFSTDSKQIQMMAYGALGDAYSELNKNDDAVNYYKKAANEFTDDVTMSSEYLFRAALKLETLGKNSEALELYKELKEKYPNTQRGYSADKYIYRLSIIPNDFSVK